MEEGTRGGGLRLDPRRGKKKLYLDKLRLFSILLDGRKSGVSKPKGKHPIFNLGERI